jgi:signal transduction histidine kinase
MGIPPEDLPHVFDPFRRGSNVAGQIGGTGLGLAGARHIVEQHEGAITIESTLGQGTAVRVELPTGTDAKDAPRTSEQDAAP